MVPVIEPIFADWTEPAGGGGVGAAHADAAGPVASEVLSMAGMGVIFSSAEVALVAATAKTVLQVVAPTNQRLKVKRLKLTFDGTSALAEPVNVRVLRQTTAGGTPSAVAGVKKNPSLPETIQSTAATATGTEPTSGDVIDRFTVHPQGGYEIIHPDGGEPEIPGAGRLGIECNAPAGVNVTPLIEVEE